MQPLTLAENMSLLDLGRQPTIDRSPGRAVPTVIPIISWVFVLPLTLAEKMSLSDTHTFISWLCGSYTATEFQQRQGFGARKEGPGKCYSIDKVSTNEGR